MKYFLDFEGTQFNHRIISIGAVCENGHSFYSLVKPESHYKITELITNMTGITKEDIDNAPSATEVFENFYNWVSEQEKENWNPQWYAWGNEDLNFVRNTFRDAAENLTARLVLGDIAGGLIDYCNVFCLRYNIKQRGLLKVAQSFDKTKEQNHNALSDAILLNFIYTCNEEKYSIAEIKRMTAHLTEVEEKKPTPTWTKSDLPNGMIVTISNKRKVVHSFDCAEAAARWLINEKKIKGKTEEELAKKILKTAKDRGNYYVSWRMIGE